MGSDIMATPDVAQPTAGQLQPGTIRDVEFYRVYISHGGRRSNLDDCHTLFAAHRAVDAWNGSGGVNPQIERIVERREVLSLEAVAYLPPSAVA